MFDAIADLLTTARSELARHRRVVARRPL